MQGRSLTLRRDALSVPLADLKGAARATGLRVNDAFLAAVAGGLGRYHDRREAPVEAVRVTMPINVRGDDLVAGNRYAPARFPLPVGIADPRERMAAIAARVAAERAEPAVGLVEGFAGVLRRLPGPVRLGLFGGMLRSVDVVASNVPGVAVPLYAAGARLESLVAFGPPCGAAVNVTLLSYLDRAAVGVVTDAAAVPDPGAFVACLREGFDEVAALA